MSLVALTWAFDQYLPPAEKIVLLALADYADDTGRCWPSQETLTRKTSLSIRTIRNHIRDLEALDLVVTEERRRDDGGRLSNMYVLALPPRQILPDPPADSDRTPRQTVAGTREPSIEPSVNTPPTPSRASRLVEGWRPKPETVEAIKQECPGLDVVREHRKFEDYWLSAAGTNAVKLDWDRTWKNWMRTAHERMVRPFGGKPEADPYAGSIVAPPGKVFTGQYGDRGEPLWRDA